MPEQMLEPDSRRLSDQQVTERLVDVLSGERGAYTEDQAYQLVQLAREYARTNRLPEYDAEVFNREDLDGLRRLFQSMRNDPDRAASLLTDFQRSRISPPVRTVPDATLTPVETYVYNVVIGGDAGSSYQIQTNRQFSTNAQSFLSILTRNPDAVIAVVTPDGSRVETGQLVSALSSALRDSGTSVVVTGRREQRR